MIRVTQVAPPTPTPAKPPQELAPDKMASNFPKQDHHLGWGTALLHTTPMVVPVNDTACGRGTVGWACPPPTSQRTGNLFRRGVHQWRGRMRTGNCHSNRWVAKPFREISVVCPTLPDETDGEGGLHCGEAGPRVGTMRSKKLLTSACPAKEISSILLLEDLRGGGP